MQKQGWIKGVISGALVTGLVLGSVGLVSATSNSTSSEQGSAKPSLERRIPGGSGHGHAMGMNMDLSSLVEDGIINSAESTAIQSKIDELKADRQAEMEKIQAMTKTERQAYIKDNKPEKIDFLTTLVNEGIISSAQAEAIQNAKQTKNQQGMQTRLKEILSSLVEKGTINAEQSELILTSLPAQQKDQKADMEDFKAMTKAERQAYIQQNPREKISPLADLVTAGSITQAQADAVMQAIPGHHGADGEGRGEGQGPGSGKAPVDNSDTRTNGND